MAIRRPGYTYRGPDRNPAQTTPSMALERYWLTTGLARWAYSPTPYRTLRQLLFEYFNRMDIATKLADILYFRHFGYHPNSDLARIAHGKPIRGKKIGRG